MISQDELSQNAMGGTELMKNGLIDRVDPKLLEKVNLVVGRERELSKDLPNIFWAHNLAEDPEDERALGDGRWERYHSLVFVSYWQMHEFMRRYNFPYSKAQVLRNAIEPIKRDEVWQDKIRLIYTPTPHRGLDILLTVWDALYKEHDNIHLDVFSSFNLYGWPERDKPYEQLFEYCREHPGITYHGAQPNDTVREHLSQAHIFAYPSTWKETSCLTAIEAMSAGLLCVTSTLGALPETMSNFGLMYNYTEDKQIHANRFYSAMKVAIKAVFDSNMKKNLAFQKQYIDTFYNWDVRKREWESFLKVVDATKDTITL